MQAFLLQAPDREAQVNEHFVAFIHNDGKLYEFGKYVSFLYTTIYLVPCLCLTNTLWYG